MGSELALEDGSPCGRFQMLAEEPIKSFRFRRFHGPVESGALSFRKICAEGKLGNDQKTALHLFIGKVHFSLFIFEKSKAGDLCDSRYNVRFGISFFYSQEEEQSGADFRYPFLGYDHTCLFDPLSNDFHGDRVA